MKNILFLFGLILVANCAIPKQFDTRVQWPKCNSRVRSQGQCDSPFFFDIMDNIEVRSCIATGKAYNISSQYVIDCCPQCGFGCDGNDDGAVLKFLSSHGTISRECNSRFSNCPNKCQDGTTPVYYGIKKLYQLQPRNVTQMQLDILSNGPLVIYIDASSTSFEMYTSGILQCTPGFQLDHTVQIIGWGVDGNAPYWIGKNSWGTNWGEEGYFKIGRGINACGVEQESVPELPGILH